MDAPLLLHGWLTLPQASVVFLLVGVAFGALLQAAGLGSARVVLGQFFGTDLRLLRVLFTALVTALVGAWALAGAGILAWEALLRPVTAPGPQVLGAVLFGVGLVVAGYCPGTALVGVVNGRWDALGVVVGLVVGAVVMGVASPLLDPWLASQSQGTQTLPGWLGLPTGVVVLGITVMGVVAMGLAEAWERRAGATPELLGGWRVTPGRVIWGGLLVVAGIGVPWPEPVTRARSLVPAQDLAAVLTQPPATIAPVALAEALRDTPTAWQIVDVQVDPRAEARLPGGIPCTLTEIAQRPWPRAGRWVVIADDAAEARTAVQVLRLRGLTEVALVAGGWEAWEREVRHPVVPFDDTAESRALVAQRRSLARHFGGDILLVRSSAPAVSPWGVPGSVSAPPTPGTFRGSSPAGHPPSTPAPPTASPAAPGATPLPPHLLGGCR